ncbi:alpha/beta fold hydrolase [Streptomyces sp. NPDC001651]|uniref:alpha/beta fold hydrolase n=1 Tax=Streptomyces sp. NPDC001651 TaxID=3364596 RepID=UPI0036AA2B8D
MNSYSEPIATPPGADPTDPLSPGTHTFTVRHGATLVEQRYHVAGRGPLCVAHSGGPGIGWEYLRMPHLERRMTMVYVEPVGTGASGRLADPRDYTIATYCHFLHAVIRHLGHDKVALLGHSHGGFVAQRYALDHLKQLSALVLYDTSPVTGDDFWTAAVAALQDFARLHAHERPEVTSFVDELTTRPEVDDDDGATAILRKIAPAYFHDYWGREADFAPGRAALRMYAAPAWGQEPPFDVRGELPGVTVPTLVVAGADDFICGPRWARMIRERIPHGQLAVLERTGHLGHIERPEKFAALVGDFLVD